MSATIHFFIRTERPMPDGSAQVYLLFTINRNLKTKVSLRKTIPLRKEYFHLKPSEILAFSTSARQDLYAWDKDKERATKETPNHENLNKFLDSERKKINDFLLKREAMSLPVSLEDFKREYIKEEGNLLFVDYFLAIIEQKKNTWAEETIRSYKSIITKIQKFKPSLTLNGINYKFLMALEDYMYKPEEEGGCGNCSRTVGNNMKVLKTLLLIAVKNKDFIKENNPFSDYKIKDKSSKLTTRDFLAPSEVAILQNLYDSYVEPDKPIHKLSSGEWIERKESKILTPGQKNTLKTFLFSCYTGLRFRDIFKLQRTEIRQNNEGLNQMGFNSRYYLEIDMHKTGEPVFVPIIDKAEKLLDLGVTGLVFQAITNQKINEHLEAIQQLSGINKVLTFHVARHTFATTARMNGIAVDILQKLLGHKNRKYTEIYTHIPHDMIMQEMSKLNSGVNKSDQKTASEKETKVIELMPLLNTLSNEKLEQLKGFLKLLG